MTTQLNPPGQAPPDPPKRSPDVDGLPDPKPRPTPVPPTAETDALERRAEVAVEAIPAIARVAAGAWLHVAAWSLETSVRVSRRLARAATDPDAAAQLVDELSSGLRDYAREFLGIADLDDRVKRLGPGSTARAERDTHSLRAQGRELLRQAADVNFEEDAHPAYLRILGELVPDEGRILRLLASDGPQPTVDVRASNLIGVGSQLIAPGLNMIGAQGGLRHRDRVAAYLHNLFRLGLLAFSEEPVSDPIAYQVLEAQPEVLSAIKETTRAKTVQRSVRLTPFGEDFCAVCLPLDEADTGSERELEPGPTPAVVPRSSDSTAK
jgi:Abortive infection alpha